MVAGALQLEEDGSYVLELDDFIFQPEQLDMTKPNVVTQSGDPAKIVADFVPRDIIGTLDDKRPVTLFGALMQGSMLLFSSIKQSFRGSMTLIGAHLRGERDLVGGIRWTWLLPAMVKFESGESPDSVVGSIPGELKAWRHERGMGFQFTAARATPLQTLRNEVQHSSGQLLGLWTAQKVPGVAHTEVLIEERWHLLTVQSDDSAPLARGTFMPVQDLSQSMFAAWIPLAHKVEPFPYILNGLSKTLQLDAQVLATGLEGLHRRLYEPRVRFNEVSSRAVERASREARHAGVKALLQEGFTDEERAHTVFSETLRHLNQITYQDRVLELLERVHEIVPSLFGPDLRQWVGMVKKIRNHQSHQLVIRFDEPSFAIYYVAVESCRWAMVLRILLELSPEYDFEAKLARSDRFSYALANIDREELWEGFSALSDFRARQKQ
ncbi:hypothetical protein GCM10027404_32610 [Arthrobacter tumbae]